MRLEHVYVTLNRSLNCAFLSMCGGRFDSKWRWIFQKDKLSFGVTLKVLGIAKQQELM